MDVNPDAPNVAGTAALSTSACSIPPAAGSVAAADVWEPAPGVLTRAAIAWPSRRCPHAGPRGIASAPLSNRNATRRPARCTPRWLLTRAPSRLAPMQLDVPAVQVAGVLVTVDRDLDVIVTATGLTTVAPLLHRKVARAGLFGCARSCPGAAARAARPLSAGAGRNSSMERDLSARAERRRRVEAVRAVLHPFELATARAGVKTDRGELASVPQFTATGHEVVGRRRRRRRRGGGWHDSAAHGEGSRCRLARNDGDGHRGCGRQRTGPRQSRQRD